MDLELSGRALKSFYHSLQGIARIGSNALFRIEGRFDRLILRVVNNVRSAYLIIAIDARHFDKFFLPSSVSCSILIKSALAVFRTPTHLMKKLTIKLASESDEKVEWIVYCLSGMSKCYRICINDDSTDFIDLDDPSLYESNFVGRAKDMIRLLHHFHPSLSELTVIASQSLSQSSHPSTVNKAMEWRSFQLDGEEKRLHTQLWIDTSEELLSYFHVRETVDVTFSVKDFKSFLQLCESESMDVQLNFSNPGLPILLRPVVGMESEDSILTMSLVLATMTESALRKNQNDSEPMNTNINMNMNTNMNANMNINTNMNANANANANSNANVDMNVSNTSNQAHRLGRNRSNVRGMHNQEQNDVSQNQNQNHVRNHDSDHERHDPRHRSQDVPLHNASMNKERIILDEFKSVWSDLSDSRNESDRRVSNSCDDEEEEEGLRWSRRRRRSNEEEDDDDPSPSNFLNVNRRRSFVPKSFSSEEEQQREANQMNANNQINQVNQVNQTNNERIVHNNEEEGDMGREENEESNGADKGAQIDGTTSSQRPNTILWLNEDKDGEKREEEEEEEEEEENEEEMFIMATPPEKRGRF